MEPEKITKCKYLTEGKTPVGGGVPLPLCKYDRLKPCPYGNDKTSSLTWPAADGNRYPLCKADGIIPEGLEKKFEQEIPGDKK